MGFREYRREIRAWAFCNVRLLAIKLSVSILSIAPGKLVLLRTIGWGLGVVSMLRNRDKWPGIVAFANHIESPERPLTSIKKYFVAQSQCRIFASCYFEAPRHLGKFITIKNFASLADSIDGKKGALFLGAHYGPTIASYLLSGKGLDVSGLFGRDQRPFLTHVFKYGLPRLMRKKWLFYANTLKPLVARKNERQILKHLQRGGVAFILTDMPRTGAGGSVVEFLGRTARFNDFSFKMAARHDVPVYFFVFDAVRGGYCLNLERVFFETPEEGVQKYADFFQEKIVKDPSMWLSTPYFTQRFPSVTAPTSLLKS